eukprot:TRINITY_DN51252_c0_g1_i1.p1 TRINITY_DN51252_c0_g1~~TRINITY_DN51252_c0_g1_i1.p1  ORF type:complete len:481 (-),score=108.38 TRINITY_DN51252_c0_g1_i1:17-1459(-)
MVASGGYDGQAAAVGPEAVEENGTLRVLVDASWQAPGCLAKAAAFVDEVKGLQAACDTEVAAAVDAALDALRPSVKEHTERTFPGLAAVAAELLDAISKNAALPRERLEALNKAVELIEQPYPSTKSDALPEQLLAAEQGSKLYPGLVKKVEAVCKRLASDVEKRCLEALRSKLAAGGVDLQLDEKCAQSRQRAEEAFQKLTERSSDVLRLSDHCPVLLPKVTATESLLTWNVLEFPSAESKKPTIDGINPVVGQILAALNRKGADDHSILLRSMSLEAIAAQHVAFVVAFVMETLKTRADIVLLQELNHETVAQLRSICSENAWGCVFSGANDEDGKCDAITAVLSRRTFDEQSQMSVQEGKKVRQFAAGRLSDTWFVSCHMPMDESQAKKKKGVAGSCDGEIAARGVRQAIDEFLLGKDAKQLVIGGDWNTDLRLLHEKLTGATVERCDKELTLHCPAAGTVTALGVEWPIDGALCIS